MAHNPLRYFALLRSLYRTINATARDVSMLRQTLDRIEWRIDKLQRSVGRVESRQINPTTNRELAGTEFQVYSQWGEDGIIDFLTRNISVQRRLFVEIGVQDYREANTRFLLQNQNWSGLIIDSSQRDINALRRDAIYWLYNLKAECCFVDVENVNQILLSNGVSGPIGLLSIDIDGNDYWVWDAIDVVQPDIVVCEYNSLFGAHRKVTIPYDRSFERKDKHYSYLYFGASIAALHSLGQSKGYDLVGSNSAGCNLFFVRRQLTEGLDVLTPVEAYVRQQFRESRDQSGLPEPLDFEARVQRIGALPLYDLDLGHNVSVSDLYLAPGQAE